MCTVQEKVISQKGMIELKAMSFGKYMKKKRKKEVHNRLKKKHQLYFRSKYGILI